jgi:multiple antibiotic resistance protein
MTMIEDISRTLVMLTAVIDPLGTVALFLIVTGKLPQAQRKKVAMRGVAYAALILVGFIVLGQIILNLLGIRMESFQIAGGVILFLFGLKMIFDKGDEFGGDELKPGRDPAIYPMAMPSIAGPGAIMAVIVLTDNDRYCFSEQAETTVLLLVVLFITLGGMLMANRIHRWIGDGGINIAMRVMGLVLAALATETVITGVLTLLKVKPG